jgi:hypothetical protein
VKNRTGKAAPCLAGATPYTTSIQRSCLRVYGRVANVKEKTVRSATEHHEPTDEVTARESPRHIRGQGRNRHFHSISQLHEESLQEWRETAGSTTSRPQQTLKLCTTHTECDGKVKSPKPRSPLKAGHTADRLAPSRKKVA